MRYVLAWIAAFVIAPWLLVAGFVFGVIWLAVTHPGIAGSLLLLFMVVLLVKFVHWGIERAERKAHGR